MPVEFLSDEQVGAYGRFTGELSVAEVERFFYLDDADRDLIARRRSDHHRLGFAVQLGTVRAVGRFLEDPLDVPWPAVEFLAEQIEIGDASCVKKYVQRPQTPYEHAWEIRDRYGYRSFDDPGRCATRTHATARTTSSDPGSQGDPHLTRRDHRRGRRRGKSPRRVTAPGCHGQAGRAERRRGAAGGRAGLVWIMCISAHSAFATGTGGVPRSGLRWPASVPAEARGCVAGLGGSGLTAADWKLRSGVE